MQVNVVFQKSNKTFFKENITESKKREKAEERQQKKESELLHYPSLQSLPFPLPLILTPPPKTGSENPHSSRPQRHPLRQPPSPAAKNPSPAPTAT